MLGRKTNFLTSSKRRLAEKSVFLGLVIQFLAVSLAGGSPRALGGHVQTFWARMRLPSALYQKNMELARARGRFGSSRSVLQYVASHVVCSLEGGPVEPRGTSTGEGQKATPHLDQRGLKTTLR